MDVDRGVSGCFICPQGRHQECAARRLRKSASVQKEITKTDGGGKKPPPAPYGPDKVELSIRKQRTKIFDERGFVLSILVSVRVIRYFVEVNRLRRTLDEILAETLGHV